MNGQLRDHPLAELICEISAERLSGALRLVRERVKAVIHFDAGAVVSARTNLRQHRLDESLKRWKAVAPEKLDALLSKEMSDAQVYEALRAAGIVTPAELQKFRAQQAEDVLRPLLLWTDGQWAFDVHARLEEGVRLAVDVSGLVLEASRRLPPEFIAERLADETETVSPSGKSLDGQRLLPEEAFVLSRADAQILVGELLAISGMPEEQTRRAVYALSLSGFLRRTGGARVFHADALKRAMEAPAAKPATAAQPVEAAKVEAALPADAGADAAQEAPDPQAELDQLFLRAGATTHYGVLGVVNAARPDEIKRAYYALARRFHPDRFRHSADESLRPRIEFSFGKITQAYEVLKDSTLRAAYDLKIKQAQQTPQPQPKNVADTTTERSEVPVSKQAPASTAPPSSPQYRAEECFQQGVAALQQKNPSMATKYLGEAALLMPKQARYRALYGRALAFDRQTRRQAESELQTAIALDAQNVSYRVMLAELYQEIGLRRRAEGELERALSIDPRHEAARRLLDTLRGAT